jgi:hypothetical protein
MVIVKSRPRREEGTSTRRASSRPSRATRVARAGQLFLFSLVFAIVAENRYVRDSRDIMLD